jgi:hypothetical protein
MKLGPTLSSKTYFIDLFSNYKLLPKFRNAFTKYRKIKLELGSG